MFGPFSSLDTFVTSVVFDEEALELALLETDEQTESLVHLHVLSFPYTDDPELVELIMRAQDQLREVALRVRTAARAGNVRSV